MCDKLGAECKGNIKQQSHHGDAFCRPLMSKADIKAKVESLTSRIKKTDFLRQVHWNENNWIPNLISLSLIPHVRTSNFECLCLKWRCFWNNACRLMNRGQSFQLHPSRIILHPQLNLTRFIIIDFFFGNLGLVRLNLFLLILLLPLFNVSWTYWVVLPVHLCCHLFLTLVARLIVGFFPQRRWFSSLVKLVVERQLRWWKFL